MSRLSQSQTMRKLDFSEKLIQPGKKETVDQQLKRVKVGHSTYAIGATVARRQSVGRAQRC